MSENAFADELESCVDQALNGEIATAAEVREAFVSTR